MRRWGEVRATDQCEACGHDRSAHGLFGRSGACELCDCLALSWSRWRELRRAIKRQLKYL